MKIADLHTHSYYSDGRMSPKEVLKIAKKRKVKILALTDHNTTGGVNEAILEGKKLGIKVIPGVEVVAEEDEVLAYFIDLENEKFQEFLAKIRRNIQKKIKKRCDNMRKAGFPISFTELEKKFPKAKGNLNEFYPYYLLILKKYGKNFKDIGRLMKQLGVKKAKAKYFSIERAIKEIRKAGGFPVLAHPWADEQSRRLLEDENFKKLVDAGLKGIEIDNGDRDERRNKEIVKKIKELAVEYNLIITSGSDFHGKHLDGAETHMIGRLCDEKIIEIMENGR